VSLNGDVLSSVCSCNRCCAVMNVIAHSVCGWRCAVSLGFFRNGSTLDLKLCCELYFFLDKIYKHLHSCTVFGCLYLLFNSIFCQIVWCIRWIHRRRFQATAVLINNESFVSQDPIVSSLVLCAGTEGGGGFGSEPAFHRAGRWF
jgi:hypothetical protein